MTESETERERVSKRMKHRWGSVAAVVHFSSTLLSHGMTWGSVSNHFTDERSSSGRKIYSSGPSSWTCLLVLSILFHSFPSCFTLNVHFTSTSPFSHTPHPSLSSLALFPRTLHSPLIYFTFVIHRSSTFPLSLSYLLLYCSSLSNFPSDHNHILSITSRHDDQENFFFSFFLR